MRRLHLTGAVLAMASMLSTDSALGCGDHLLILGRGVRFQHAYAQHRGNLVIYFAGTQSGANPKSSKLQGLLQQAGHKLQTAQGLSELDEVLKSGKIDVVLADFNDLAGIARELQSAPTKPIILPILFKPSKAQFAAVQREYQFALSAPADDVRILTAIDQAMKSRLRIGSRT